MQEHWSELFFKANKIVFLGDSITEAASQEGGYIWLLERFIDRSQSSISQCDRCLSKRE